MVQKVLVKVFANIYPIKMASQQLLMRSHYTLVNNNAAIANPYNTPLDLLSAALLILLQHGHYNQRKIPKLIVQLKEALFL